MNADELTQVLRDLVARLRAAGIRFYLTGGLVSAFYGEPRFTQDIDLVLLLPDASDLEAFAESVAPDYLLDRELLADAVREQGMAQLLHETTMIRVDLHIGEMVPGMFLRVRDVELFPGVVVPVLSKEDAILTKLRWIQLGSHKSRRDALMMLRRDTPTDREYLETQAAALGVQALLEELDAMGR